MPIVGWICPMSRDEVPFGHFETCTHWRGTAAYPPWLARFTEQRILGDTRHATLRLSATRCLGCPRATYIETQYRIFVDPRRRAAMDRGSANHSVASRSYDPENWYTESNDAIRMTCEGTLFGAEITGQLDALRRDMSEIVDNKFPKDWSVAMRAKDKGTPKPEYQVQLNIQRLLLGQQDWAKVEGYDADNVRMTIWDHALGKEDGPEPMTCKKHLSEAEMLDMRPWGGEPTVREIVAIHEDMRVAHEIREMSVEELAAALPLTGETQMGGKKCTAYCDLAKICNELVVKFGRPR